MNITYLAVALVGTLIYRIYLFRQFKKYNPEGDEISHLLILKAIQQNGNRIPQTISQFVLNHNDYPNGFHKLIALCGLPFRFWEKNGGYVPITCDVLLLLWIAGFLTLTGGQEFAWLLLFPAIRLLWSRESRSNDFGERAFGVLTGNIYLGAIFFYSATHHWAWLLIASLAFTLSSTSSKFSNQAILFFTLFMGVTTFNWIYPVAYLGCLTVATIVTRGYVLKVFRGQILYSVHYRLHRMQRTLRRNFYQDIVGSFKRFKLSRFSFFFFENPLFMLVTSCPVNLAFLLIWGLNGFPLDSLTLYVLCGSVLALIIATEPLKYLGQPERYLEFCLPPMFAYLAKYPVEDHWSIFTIAFLLGFWAMFYHVNNSLKQQTDHSTGFESYRHLRRFLAKQPMSTILTIPLKCSNNLVYMLNKHRYVTNFTHCRNRQQYKAYEELMPDYYPFPGARLKTYTDQYNIDLIIYRKASEKRINQLASAGYYDFTCYETVYETIDFIVFRVQPLPQPSLY